VGKKKQGAEAAQDTAASIMVVLDASGSMAHLVPATLQGFNEFLHEQAKLPGAAFSLVIFEGSSVYDQYVDVPVKAVPDLDTSVYRIGGSTPLYDAVGKGVTALEARQPKGKVVVAIVTDGAENSSREWDRQKVYDLVERKRKDGWEFVFMGAGIDAYQAGTAIGVAARSTHSYDHTLDSTQSAYASLSSSTSGFRTGAQASVAMPGDERTAPDGLLKGATPFDRPIKAEPLPRSTLGSTK
jgi:Mg-chelatase subunit ChlD